MLHKLGYEYTCEVCEEPKREEDFSVTAEGGWRLWEATCNDCIDICQRCEGPEGKGCLVSDLCDTCAHDMGVL